MNLDSDICLKVHLEAIARIRKFIEDRKKGIERGHVLVTGMAGMGKSHLLKTLFPTSPSLTCASFYSKYLGQSEQALWNIIMNEQSDGIVILEDIQDICSIEKKNNGIEGRLLSILKDSLPITKNIIIAVCHDFSILDPYLLRGDCFSLEVRLFLSKIDQRKLLLNDLRNESVLSEDDINRLAEFTHGYSILDILRLRALAFDEAATPTINNFLNVQDRIIPSAFAHLPLLLLNQTNNQREEEKLNLLIGLQSLCDHLFDLIRLPLLPSSPSSTANIKKYKLKLPQGAIIHGPTGSGKTQLALWAASRTGLPIIHVQATQIRSKYVGQSEKNLAALFRRARECSPCILFIDQIDGLFASRGQGGSADRLITCLLTELDGVHSTINSVNPFFVLAATSRLDKIDPAIRRPGRLGVQIQMPDYGAEWRRQFLAERIERMQLMLTEEEQMEFIQLAEGRRPADLDGILQRAGFDAIRMEENPSHIKYKYIAKYLK